LGWEFWKTYGSEFLRTKSFGTWTATLSLGIHHTGDQSLYVSIDAPTANVDLPRGCPRAC
jgi:hypothetical protein